MDSFLYHRHLAKPKQDLDDSSELSSQVYEDSGHALDDITLAGRSKDNPLRLLIPFCLPSQKSMWIASPYVVDSLSCHTRRFERNTQFPMQIYCPNPVKIQYNNGDNHWLVPRAPLLPVFVRGWNKLPNELKINILEFNLICDTRIDLEIYDYHLDILHDHLRMTPEIADMSENIFFGKNEFEFHIEDLLELGGSDWNYYRLAQISKLCLRVYVNHEHYEGSWEVIEALFAVLDCFTNLSHVILKIQWGTLLSSYGTVDPGDESKWLELLQSILGDGQASVAADGEVIFLKDPKVDGLRGRIYCPSTDVLAKMEDLIKSRVIFQPKA